MQTPCDQAVSKDVRALVQEESGSVMARSPLGLYGRLGDASLAASSTTGDNRLYQPQRSAYAESEDGVKAEEASMNSGAQHTLVQDMALQYPAHENKTASSMQPLSLPGGNPDPSRCQSRLQAGQHLEADDFALWHLGLVCHCTRHAGPDGGGSEQASPREVMPDQEAAKQASILSAPASMEESQPSTLERILRQVHAELIYRSHSKAR